MDVYNADRLDFSNIEDWQTFEEVEKHFPHFKKASLNWALRNRKRNGLDKIVKRFGKQNFIHVPGFSIWLSQR